MAYGVLIKNANTKNALHDDNITFYPTQRSGISTSDPYFFSTINFTTKTMQINFAEYGNLISSSAGANFSYMNFDLNSYNFNGSILNLSKPSIVEICKITSYESGIGQTVYSENFNIGTKFIKNFTDPGNIYIKTESPLGFQTSYFGNILNYAEKTSDLQNFLYVKYESINHNKYFITIPGFSGATIPNNFSWYELPDNNFYNDVNYYVTLNKSAFIGKSLDLSYFNGIIPSRGESILINNSLFDDTLSGLYVISAVNNNVMLSKGPLSYNYPGQTFINKIDLDLSNSFNYNSSVYYVPFGFGYSAEVFTKNLQLVKFINNYQNSTSQYIPLYRDSYSYSSMMLSLKTINDATKQSDSFILGIAVSNWFPDSLLFGVGINYEIKEGY